MGPRLGRVEYRLAKCFVEMMNGASMGPRLGRVEYIATDSGRFPGIQCASMGPRLGRVEYPITSASGLLITNRFNGATLRTRGIHQIAEILATGWFASMGPRLGRVEY